MLLEALDLLMQHPVDLVISDLIMDGMNGLTLLEQIRQHPSLAQLPFVLLTGKMHQFQEDARQLLVSGIFSKPVQESDFIQAITRILNSGKTADKND